MSTGSPMEAPTPAAPEISDVGALAGVKLGNYRLERVLGRGRMGVVYLANDEALLRPTAIKVLSWRVADAQGQDRVQWFLSEARHVARINHPRVVQIYGAARHGDHCYIAMEYVAGCSAEALVARDGPMAGARATDVLVQAASALDAAHRAGVVHRDVKPANLLVAADGVTKLGDFGMALGPAAVSDARLRVGTPYYLAPELWRGEAASAASDLYALGAAYFQLLTGRPPFPARDVSEVETQHRRGRVPDPRQITPAVPAACASLAMWMLQKSPADRPQSADQVLVQAARIRQDLAEAAATSSTSGVAVLESATASARHSRGRSEPMSNLAQVAKLADVKGAVEADLDGSLVEAVGEADGETAAAVMGVVANTLMAAGDQLGLGALRRVSVNGRAGGLLIAVQDRSLTAAYVDAPAALAAVEKSLDAEQRTEG